MLYLHQVFIKFVTVHVSCGNLIDIDKDGIDELLSQMFMENGNVVTVCEMLGFSSLGHDVTNIGYLSLGFKDGYLKGSQVMDEILWNEEDGYTRRTNNLGGFEGGMTNGQPIVVRGVMKPIPTLYKPLMSVDIETHEPYKATVERSDPTALPAAGVVMESVVATVVANEILDKFSSDNMEELKEAVARHRDYVKNF